jgi:hypothetical protein
MTKREMLIWKTESIEQAIVQLTMERYTELQAVMKAAREVC